MRYLTWIFQHEGDIVHAVVHISTMLTAAYYWFQHSVLKDVLEERLERRHKTMINPVTIVNDINLAVQTVEKLKAALPLVTKLVADVRQAYAEKSDPTKLEANLTVVMNDVNDDLNMLQSLFPAQKVTVTPAPPSA